MIDFPNGSALLACLLTAACAHAVFAQSPYPAGTYRSPVDHTIKVSGTFGELRADHFHMGVDIKSARGVAGDPLYAVADGFVSRLRVSARGYGNSMYIDHPNGTRSVYAHLDAFTPDVQAFLDSVHYAHESFELDLEGLSPKLFPIARGQRIGVMGNTGSSRGAHLHFELRLAENDAAFNPLLYDFPVNDSRAPEIRGLSVYRRLPHGATQTLEFVKPLKASAGYELADPLHVPAGHIGFGIKAYDRQQGTRNLNGVFAVESRVDDALHWRAQYDTVAFEDTRYIQAHYDYPAKRGGDGYYYRMHRLPGDALGLYEVAPDDGFVVLGFGESRTVETVVSDPFGNAATLRFEVVADVAEAVPFAPSYNYLVPQGQAATLAVGDAELSLSPRAVYADTYLEVSTSEAPPAGAYSRCYALGDADEPLHEGVSLRVPLSGVPMDLRPNAYLSACDDATEDVVMGRLSTGSTHLEVGLDSWGEYVLRVDTLAPTIRTLDRYTYLVDDDVTPASALRYRVSQGGAWVLASYDAKRNRLELRRDKLGTGSIVVEVWDAAGNSARTR